MYVVPSFAGIGSPLTMYTIPSVLLAGRAASVPVCVVAMLSASAPVESPYTPLTLFRTPVVPPNGIVVISSLPVPSRIGALVESAAVTALAAANLVPT